MKFTKLTFENYTISTYSKDFSNALQSLSLKISEYAIRIRARGKNAYIMKIDFYSELGFSEEHDSIYSLPYQKCFLYDISINAKLENTVYPYKYLGNLYYDKSIHNRYYLNDKYSIKNLEFYKYFLFNNTLYYCNNEKYHYSDEELELLLKEHIYKENNKFQKLKKEIDLFEKINNLEYTEKKREPIPEEVKFEVWRRDEGKCVICGSKENLEFDHIIPFSKGGGNTTRNIQLLCESCNRKKSDKI